MIAAEGALQLRARRAYEHGRLRWAVGRAVTAAAVTALALLECPAPGGPTACIAALSLVVAASLWRGGSWARGARLGYLAGLAPCLLPAAAHALHARCESFCPALPAVCIAGGVVAGLLLGGLGVRIHGDRRFWLAAAVAALLAGAVGCLPAGLAGLAGMALGIVGGALAPVLAARTA